MKDAKINDIEHGMTTRTFRERMDEHRDYPKRDVFTEPAGEHFTKRKGTVLVILRARV